MRQGCTAYAEKFETKTRFATLDVASSNTRYESVVGQQERKTFETIQMKCRVHRAATCKDHAISGVPRALNVISGQLHWALSLREQPATSYIVTRKRYVFRTRESDMHHM